MPFTYFTEAELRTLPDMDNSTKYTTERLQAAHDWIVGVVERECNTSFIEKTATNERFTGRGLDSVVLRHDYVTAVTAVTMDGVVFTGDQLAALVYEDGVLYRPDGATWTKNTRGNVTLSYTYGYSDEPPADLKEAMMRGARHWVMSTAAWSGVDSRQTAISNEYGNIQLATAGPDRPTGLPDVDSTIVAWRDKVRIPGFA